MILRVLQPGTLDQMYIGRCYRCGCTVEAEQRDANLDLPCPTEGCGSTIHIGSMHKMKTADRPTQLIRDPGEKRDV